MLQDHSPSTHKLVVCHKTIPDAHACLTNDPAKLAIFMWGRSISSYQLYVNGREYEWEPHISELNAIERYLKFCLEMDEVLYECD